MSRQNKKSGKRGFIILELCLFAAVLLAALVGLLSGTRWLYLSALCLLLLGTLCGICRQLVRFLRERKAGYLTTMIFQLIVLAGLIPFTVSAFRQPLLPFNEPTDGEVVSVQAVDDGRLLRIRNEAGREETYLLDGETKYSSQIPDVEAESYFAAPSAGDRLHVTPGEEKRSVHTEEGTREVRRLEQVILTAVVSRGGVTLEDGTAVDMVTDANAVLYQLEDGSQLLEVQHTDDLAEVLSTLSSDAQAAIHTYYNTKGLPYDLAVELEAAYQLRKEHPEGGQSPCISLVLKRNLAQETDSTLSIETEYRRMVWGKGAPQFVTVTFDRITGAVVEAAV